MNEQSENRAVQLPPTIILCEPQLGENIGTAARAMANFGVTDLRIVNPREGWPNEKARAAASRADHVIDNVQVFETPEEAVADLQFIYATTARNRELVKPVRGPDEAARTLTRFGADGTKTGLMFGRERWGLNNEEVALADEIVTLPVDPDFASLNIAQAVLLLCYEWRTKAMGEILPFGAPDSLPAPKIEIIRLFEHLESALDKVRYFRPPEMRSVMELNLRTIFGQAQLTEQQVRTLRGVVAALEGRKSRPRKREGVSPPDEIEKGTNG
ncbi:MAG: RNA methyltransferase [Stappiaceae bacterium]